MWPSRARVRQTGTQVPLPARLDGASPGHLAVYSLQIYKLARRAVRQLYRLARVVKAGQSSEASENSARPRKIPMKAQYLRGDLDAARQEALLHAQQVAPALRGLDLTELLDRSLSNGQVESESEIAKCLWPYVNLPESAKPDWLARLRWGLTVNYLIGDWILANADCLDSLDDILDDPDWSLLLAAQTEGRPAILAGAHLGPRSVAVHAINRRNLPVLMLLGNLTYGLTIASQPFLTPSDRHVIMTLRDKLAACGTVYVAGDGKSGGSRLSNRFFGTPVILREGIAALAWVTRAQTFWCAARWAGRRIVLDLVAGPLRQDGESREDWNARWASFYVAQIEKSVLHGPENLRPKTLRLLLAMK
jgi:hypothetical protein